MVVDDDTDDEGARDDIEGLLNDAFGDHAEGVTVGPNEEAKKFYNLIDGQGAYNTVDIMQTKFILPDSGEKWVIQAIRDAWKRFKGKIKQKHFVPFDTIEDMVKNRPTQVPESQFIKLIYYWSHPTIQSITEKNKKHKEQQKFPHRMGPINFGRVRVALRATKETNEEPKRFEMFLATRTSRKRKEVDQETQDAIV
ncbi:uncharacterized protein LOC110263755 [Arachis ipaensis]|uniref:uncharacterized protein LOC110263755 n=1 Tax=Arachis ipaensis TaxID=130454 RepID=UPI000A2B8029|nr:uncharacterized protein LOC110263755 [Arachis ipaensis]